MNDSVAFMLMRWRGDRWTVREAAAGVGIDPAVLSKYENSRRTPSVNDLAKIASWYQLDESEIEALYLASGRLPPGLAISHRRVSAPSLRQTSGSRSRRPRQPAWSTLRIENEASALIESLATKDRRRGWNRPPVDFDRIAREVLHLEIRYIRLRELDDGLLGALDWEKRVILIDESVRGTSRYAFTVCHEIGHFLLHPPGSGNSSATREREANQFATSLLLPAPLLREWVRSPENAMSADPVLSVASAFGVSRESTEIRMRELRLL